MPHKLSRREFMKLGLGAGTGLVIGISLQVPVNAQQTRQDDHTFKPDIWVSVDSDNTVTVTIAESEMGQGVFTTLPMMVAEELEADWGQMRAVPALADQKYGYQQTGGSSSLRNNWNKLRMAGAAAKEMLLVAASQKWAIQADLCKAESGFIINTKTSEKVSYGDLVDIARNLPLPKSVSLKSPEHFKIIGRPLPRLDSPDKIIGKAVYGSDMTLEGMLTATVIHPPVFGGSVKSLDSKDAKQIDGVKDIIQIKEGVAVIGDDFWSAHKGAQALKIEWNNGPNARLSSKSIHKKLNETLQKPGEDIARDDGNAQEVITSASQRIESQYEVPFQAHAPLEPMTCTANVQDGLCEVWAPTQAPTKSKKTASKLTQSQLTQLYNRLKQRIFKSNDESTILHTTLLGGSFGRRLQTDFVSEAVQISMAMNTPIRLIWSREEDIQHDFYRPTTLHHISATLDDKGMPVAWWHKSAGPDLGLSGARDLPYDIPNIRVEGTNVDIPVPTGPWRSVSHSYNAFVIESFMDELAAVHKHDPLEYRLKLLGDPQYRRVLERAADKAQWGKTLPEGHHHGLAVYKSFGTYVAQIAEISLDDNNQIRVHKVTAAIDCGMVVNPDTVAAQMEGAITFGLSAVLKGQITIRDGRVEQSNYHDFPILRFDEMPVVDTIIINSEKSPEGIGEPGVPSIGPAVANALFSATGQRQRSLPLR